MADVVVGVRVRYGRLAACCAVAFAALALAATLGWLRPFDQQLFRSIYTTAPCDVRQASAMANPLFSGELSLLWCAAGAALLAWRRRRPVLGAWLLGLMLLTVPIELVCKRILDQPSPGTFVATLSRRSCTVAAPATGHERARLPFPRRIRRTATDSVALSAGQCLCESIAGCGVVRDGTVVTG